MWWFSVNRSSAHSIDLPISLCFLSVLQSAVGRDVTLPSGPLFRVAGFPLALPCTVSGFEGSRTQEFEWFLYRDNAGGRQMGVVSTRDKGFPYAPFQSRVRNGEVRVERDSGDKVRLVIQRLRAEDQGKYECYTPSTDSTYQGNYSATIAVKGMILQSKTLYEWKNIDPMSNCFI